MFGSPAVAVAVHEDECWRVVARDAAREFLYGMRSFALEAGNSFAAGKGMAPAGAAFDVKEALSETPN
jgi:hypothetical protein